jgi:hypothetical protein
MNKPWLIYRCTFKKNGTSEGVDSLLRFDYMGSAEYEFGALPKSLKRMVSKIEKMEIFKTPYKRNDGKGLFLLCLPEEREYECYIHNMVQSKYEKLKEQIYLKANIDGTASYSKSDIFWDIENDIIFGFGEEEVDAVREAIDNFRKKSLT